MRLQVCPMRTTSMTFVLLATFLGATGCVALLVGGGVAAGTIIYVQGELKTLEEDSLDRVWSATVSAVEALEFRLEEKHKDGLNGTLVANTADGTKIQIKLEKRSRMSTEIRIRVGVFGDEHRSTLILNEIRARL